MKDCEADAETGLDVQCTSMREMGMKLGRLGDCQIIMQREGGRKGGGKIGKKGLRLQCICNNV